MLIFKNRGFLYTVLLFALLCTSCAPAQPTATSTPVPSSTAAPIAVKPTRTPFPPGKIAELNPDIIENIIRPFSFSCQKPDSANQDSDWEWACSGKPSDSYKNATVLFSGKTARTVDVIIVSLEPKDSDISRRFCARLIRLFATISVEPQYRKDSGAWIDENAFTVTGDVNLKKSYGDVPLELVLTPTTYTLAVGEVN